MQELSLLLYSRQGCCLCEGLEEALGQLELANLQPPLILHVIDIDGAEISAELRGRYDMEVPVLALSGGDLDSCVSLPRASPRLRGTGLRDWLQKQLRQLADRG